RRHFEPATTPGVRAVRPLPDPLFMVALLPKPFSADVLAARGHLSGPQLSSSHRRRISKTDGSSGSSPLATAAVAALISFSGMLKTLINCRITGRLVRTHINGW